MNRTIRGLLGRAVLAVSTAILPASPGLGSGTGPSTEDPAMSWEWCMQEATKTAVWGGDLPAEEAVFHAYRICRWNFRVLLTGLPSDAARETYRIRLNTEHASRVAFAAEMIKRGDPMAKDNDFIETEDAASTPAVKPSQDAQANVLATAPTPPPVQFIAARKQYNPAKLTIQTNVPACRRMSDYDKWINLISAGRRDLADRLDCVEIPAGEQVILMDELDIFRQIYWEFDGIKFQGWLLKEYALDDFDIEVKKSCKISEGDFDCFDTLMGQFERVNN